MPPLRILTYNVRYFGHALKGLASTKSAMGRIAEAIARLDPLPDMLCLQEVETDSLRSTIADRKAHPEETQLERLMAHLHGALLAAGKPDRYEAYYFPAHAYRLTRHTSIYTTGLAILAHGDFAVHHHNAGAPEDITHRRIHAVRRLKQTRICAHVRFTHRAGRTLDIFNTHLSLPTTLSRAFWTERQRMGYGPNQLAEARNLVQFIRRVRKSDRFIVMGDFNSLPGSPVYRLLTEEHGLHDPFAELHQMSAEEICHWPTAGFLNLRMHLDHIFAGPEVSFLDFADSYPFGSGLTEFDGLSDHVPLIARCRL